MVGNVLAQMMDGDGMDGGGWWWIWVVGGVVVVALLAVLVIEMTRRNTRGYDSPPVHPGPRTAAPDAEQVLADRFARGEIDVEEFEKRRAALRR